MVSKASDDLPDPDRPVMQIRRFRGSRTVTSLRLCSRAPWTISSSEAMRSAVYRPNVCSSRLGASGGSGLAPAAEDEAADGEAEPERADGESADGQRLA